MHPLYDQSLHRTRIELAHSISEKMYARADLELQLLHILLNPVFIIWRDSCYFCVGLLVNMDKMSFPWIITVTTLCF